MDKDAKKAIDEYFEEESDIDYYVRCHGAHLNYQTDILPCYVPEYDTVRQTKRFNSAALILFHGNDGTGKEFKRWMKIVNKGHLQFPHICVIYPTAPVGRDWGGPRLWLPEDLTSIDSSEDKDAFDLMCHKVSQIIHREVAKGIPLNRIVIGGFAMGGTLALHVAYRFYQSLAGCIVMSSFLPNNSIVYKALKTEPATELPELLQFHGTADSTIPKNWGEETYKRLQVSGVTGTFVPLESVTHNIVPNEIDIIKNWLQIKLPPIEDINK